jgi:hypothetical protein
VIVSQNVLIKAMAGERNQKKRLNAAPQTTKKPKLPERSVIGSSSTWKQEQLDRFGVQCEVCDMKTMIPEKWFEFKNLEQGSQK